MIWNTLGVTNPELIEVEDPLSQDIASDFDQRVMAATPPFCQLKTLTLTHLVVKDK